MLRRMGDMPAGTIGFEAVGEVEDGDWEEQVEPLLRSEMAEGQPIRPAMRALSFLLPGKARAFPVHEQTAAKAWLAEDDE